jgi:hypothetical protein
MSDFNRNPAVRGFGADRAVAIDAGLRAYMIRVYNYMAGGVAVTGVVAWLAFQAAGGDDLHFVRGTLAGATPFGQALFSLPAILVLFFGTLGMVYYIGARIDRMQVGTALTMFLVYSGLFGLLLSDVFVMYTGVSITRVFFVTAASFGALSLYGYTTQRSLSAIGSFLMMGVFGLIIAMVVNAFLGSNGLDFVISALGVLIFAGLTAYHTQGIKEMYDPQEDGTMAGRKAVMGALQLYLDFINLFMFLLRFLGDRR